MYSDLNRGKKAIKRRQDQKQLYGHLERIRNTRPTTTGWTFCDQPRSINNGKKNMLIEDKFTQIEKANRLLLERITTTMNKRAQSVSEPERNNKTLHGAFRKKQLQNIEIQNARLLKRLQQKRSNYDSEKLKQQWKKQKIVIKNIANFPKVISDGSRRKRVQNKTFNLAYEKAVLQDDIEMMRIRNLDGVNMIITVKLDHKQMTIIGDLKTLKDVKVIEIPRDQAMEFIQFQCDGKIENVFDLLRFQADKNVLYLLSKEANEGNLEDVPQNSQQ